MVASIVIAPAQPSQIEALQALIQRAYRGQSAAASWSHEGEVIAGERVSSAALAEMIREARSRLSVALCAGRIVGSSLVTDESTGVCEIKLLSVDPDVQGQGIGDQLLSAAEMVAARDFAAGRIRIEVLAHKQKLTAYYERRGYRQTGATRPYPHTMNAPAHFMVLEKRLQP